MFGEYLDYSMKIIILMAMSVLLSLYGRYWYVMHESSSRIEKNTATKIPAETKQSIYTKIIRTNQRIEALDINSQLNKFSTQINQASLATDIHEYLNVPLPDYQTKPEQQIATNRSQK